MLLAYLPTEERRKLLGDGSFTRLTPWTVVDPDALEEQFEAIVEHGIALDSQESTLEVGCVAAPIRSVDSNVVAAMSISTLASRLDPAAHGAAVRQAVADISACLGWWAPDGILV